MVMVDDGANTNPSLVVSAQSNAFSGAALINLDPSNLSGHGPITPEYRLINHSRGAEKNYMLIPKTFVGHAMDPALPRPVILDIRYRTDDQSIVLVVRDGIYILEMSSTGTQPPSASYELFLTSDFTITSLQTHDSYDVMAKRYIGQSGLETFNTQDYFNQFTANDILYLEN